MQIKGARTGFLFAVLVFIAPNALADQAEAIPQAYALHAKALLANVTEIEEFCAPCGDKRAVSIPVHDVTVADHGDPGLATLQVDGRGLDLAYTYFPSDGEWLNLAMAVGYAVLDVPRTIGDDPAKAAVATLMEAQPGHPRPLQFSSTYHTCMERADYLADPLLGCINDEIGRQDALLNSAYQRLMSVLPPDRQTGLRTAERLWVQYRTANCSFYLYRAGGTSALITSSACKLRMTAERAREFEDMRQMYR